VITRIRALFKKAETVQEPTELNEIVQEVLVLARSEMDKKRVVLRLELAPDLPRVLGDRIQLQQVLLNLMLNGIEAMSTVEDRSRELLIRTQVNAEGEVRVMVRDSGTGLDPESIEQPSLHSIRPSRVVWGWDYPSAAPLWRTTLDGSGSRRMMAPEPLFTLGSRDSPRSQSQGAKKPRSQILTAERRRSSNRLGEKRPRTITSTIGRGEAHPPTRRIVSPSW
jgi:hypothetical protein